MRSIPWPNQALSLLPHGIPCRRRSLQLAPWQDITRRQQQNGGPGRARLERVEVRGIHVAVQIPVETLAAFGNRLRVKRVRTGVTGLEVAVIGLIDVAVAIDVRPKPFDADTQQRKRSTKGVGVWAGRGMSVSGPPWPAESGLESVTKQYPPGDRP